MTKALDDNAGNDTAVAALPDSAAIILPVRTVVVFPTMVMPIALDGPRAIAAAQQATKSDRPIGIVLRRDDAAHDATADALYTVGTVANILRYVTAPDESHHIVVQGIKRLRIRSFVDGYPFLAAMIDEIDDPEGAPTTEIEVRLLHLRERALEALQLLPQVPPELVTAIQTIPSAAMLADFVANFMDLKPSEKQQVLESFDIQARLDTVIMHLAHRIEVLRLSKEIGQQTKETMDEKQREYILREQLRTIQKQLGEEDEKAVEIAELSDAIDNAHMPDEVERQARKELKRLERMPEAAGEYSMVRTYLDTLIEVPWSKYSAGEIDIADARSVLDADHYGLEKVKRRILEFLAVRKLKPDGKSPILCFVGPPGVGKTSLGKSIALATGRKFIRASLGGVHDEAEIRGHRRTYIGAMPGSIIQNIRKAGTHDCLFMLDEVDKLGSGFQGDPSSALLEVLDPEQNATFVDNYLGIPFDLSKVFFIATANVLDAIPGPLQDRMEVIEIPGYTEEEKLQIARRYLVGRQLKANGLTLDNCTISNDALRAIICDYTREAGCRNLERNIGSVFRYVAVRVAEGRMEPMKIEAGDLHEILGPRRFENDVAMRTRIPGVATGLAWTPAGGDILFIEAARMAGSGKLILTGHLGEVMKESAQAALSLVKSRCETFGVEPAVLEKTDIHIHVPAGAIPKDGPSAGVAMTVALLSLLTDRPVRSDLAMTGEISLRGLVLPVGGIKEKVVAAARANLKTVMLPDRNKKDFEDVPGDVRSVLKFAWVEDIDQAAETALEKCASYGASSSDIEI
jgi:ATP-dependent Lon protease